jgi:ParB family chromosome partitioning protein
MGKKNPSPKQRASGAVTEIPLDRIDCGRQPREVFDEESHRELAESLRQCGLLNAIRVRPVAGDRYELVCGERRYRAARELGWATITAAVTEAELSDADRTLEQLSENLFRAALQPVEQAKAFHQLMTAENWTAKELAARLGMSQAKVSQHLRLLGLPADVQAEVDRGNIPATTAYEIAKAPAEVQPGLAREVKAGNLTRGQVKAAAGPKKPGPDRDHLKLSLVGNHFDFDVDGNKVVIKGKKIDSARLLADAVTELVAAVRAHARAADPGEAAAPAGGSVSRPRTKPPDPLQPPPDPKAGDEPTP